MAMAPWQGLYLPFLLTHVPRPGSSMATPLDVSPPWYLRYPPSGMLIYVLACTSASHIAIHHLPPQALPSFSSLSTSFRLSLFPEFGHTGRAQFPLPCLLRKNLITCPLPLWQSGGPITMSLSTAAGVAATSMAGTLPLCHTPACGELRAEGELLCLTAGQRLSFEEKHWRAMDVALQKGLRPSLQPGRRQLPRDGSGRATGWHLAAWLHRGWAAGSKTQRFLAQSAWNEL